MFEVKSQEERYVWNQYQGLIREHKSWKVKDKYFKERKMDDWEEEYKRLDNARRVKIKELNKARFIQEKEERDEEERELEKARQLRNEKRKQTLEKKRQAIEKRKQTIEENKLQRIKYEECPRRSTRLQNKYKATELEVANIMLTLSEVK